MNPTAEQLDIMRHALGMNYEPRQHRNYYCASLVDGKPTEAIGELVVAGLMAAGTSINEGAMQYFVVTPEGHKVVHDHAPPRPKLTRSQARYERYLRTAGDVMTFREYLAYEKKNPYV